MHNQAISHLAKLGQYMLSDDEDLALAVKDAYVANNWFTEENCRLALHSVANEYLDEKKLRNWAAGYEFQPNVTPKRIGLILAGNIPLVGFHDIICVLVSGHVAHVKFTERDILTRHLVGKLRSIAPDLSDKMLEVERLREIDAIIATGSNNSSRYFEYYFKKYPSILRRNRNSVAVLTGKESEAELELLGKDIFTYFGLGCRNVSKLYLPKGYDITKLLKIYEQYDHFIHHNKYKNNFDYNLSLFMLNRVAHHNNFCLIMLENRSLTPRIATLHYQFYDSLDSVRDELTSLQEQIQCVVCTPDTDLGLDTVPLGDTQAPSLSDYADRVDTMAFLRSLV